MKHTWIISIIFILLLVGCGATNVPEKKPKRIGTISVNASQNTTVDANITDVNETIYNGEGIRIRRLADNEIAYNKRNTEEYENLRERQYSTRVDLTKMNAYNCKSVMEDLTQQLHNMVDDVDELDDELAYKEAAVEKTKQEYDEALAEGDDFEVKRRRFDYNDAENEYDELRKDARQAHDDYDETERTLRIVKAECTKMRSDIGLKN